jgi:Flp pilus assembly protein TadG
LRRPAPREVAADPRERERGQIIVLFTVAFVLILGVAAVVIDLGLLRTDSARLQNALDAASLASAHSMPATPSNVASINGTAMRYLNQNFSGTWSLQPITYRCVIGLNTRVTPAVPRVTDMPSACNVSFAANSSSWRCTGTVCWAPCDPVHNATDVCNTIVLAANATRAFSFGRAVGVSSGTTQGSNSGADGGSAGNLMSAACTGLCGSPPTAPLDVVLIVDRTGSMSAAMGSLRTASNAVLQAYDPTIQRVAFGALGPSTPSTSCGSPATNVLAMATAAAGVTYVAGTSGTTRPPPPAGRAPRPRPPRLRRGSRSASRRGRPRATCSSRRSPNRAAPA